MRISPAKVNRLAELVAASLLKEGGVTVNVGGAEIEALVREVITEDLRMEDEIEEEARQMLEEHRDSIQMRGVGFDNLLMKAKQRLARERKMVL